MDDKARPRTADRLILAASMRFSPLYLGIPEQIVASLAVDPVLAEADSLTITLSTVGGCRVAPSDPARSRRTDRAAAGMDVGELS